MVEPTTFPQYARMIPMMVLPWAMITFTCGFVTSRSQPAALAGLLLFLPLFALLRLPSRVAIDRRSLTVLGIAAIGLLYAAMSCWLVGNAELNLGKFAGYAAAVMLGSAVLASGIAAERWLHALAVAGLTTFIYTVTSDLYQGVRCFTLGNVNFIGTCAAPIIYAWAAWTLAVLVRQRRVGYWHIFGLLAALAVLVTYIFTALPGSPRRGVMTSAVVAAVCALGAVAWPTRRRLVLILGVVAAVIALAGVVGFMIKAPIDARSDRVFIYRAACDGIRAALPFGDGAYSALGLSSVAGEAAAIRAATGAWTFSAHNELLESALNYGIVGAACCVALLIALAVKCLGIIDAPLRAAAAALIGAMWVHASTDAAFAYPVPVLWAGVLVGFVLHCPSADPMSRVPLRAIGWVLAIPCVFAGVRELSAAFVHLEASPAVRMRAIDGTTNADVARIEGEAALQEMLIHDDIPSAIAILAKLEPKLRGEGPLTEWRLVVAERQVQMLAARACDQFIQIRSAADLAACAGLAREIDSADGLLLAAALRYVGRLPFALKGYHALLELSRRRPDLWVAIDGATRLRAAYLDGQTGLPEPAFPGDYPTLASAVDAHARIYWMANTGRPWPAIVQGLLPLARRFSMQQDVALLVLRVASAGGPDAQPLLALKDRMADGVRMIPPSAVADVLVNATTPEQAARLEPFFAAAYPAYWREFARGELLSDFANDDQIAIRNGFVRLRMSAQRADPKAP